MFYVKIERFKTGEGMVGLREGEKFWKSLKRQRRRKEKKMNRKEKKWTERTSQDEKDKNLKWRNINGKKDQQNRKKRENTKITTKTYADTKLQKE